MVVVEKADKAEFTWENAKELRLSVANIIEEGKVGGPQVRMIRVAAALEGCVETVIIMPRENSMAFQERCHNAGVHFKALPISRITKEWRVALRYVVFFPAEVLIIARYVRKCKFKIVHVSGGSWQFKAILASKLAGKKVLWHLNDTYIPEFIRSIFSLVCRLADGFIFASERSKAYYGPLIKTGQSMYVIPAPVDVARFNPTHRYSGEEELLERWDGKFVIGTVSNVNPTKGLETFIHAAASLNGLLNDAVFVVIGQIFPRQKRYYDSLKRLCKQLNVSNITFAGCRSDVRPLLSRFDVYVCSSNAESSPISVWEAMAMAKPIVSTDVGDVPLYVQDCVNGFVVDVGDSGEMAERVYRLVRNKAQRKEFGDRCREIAIEELDVSLCAERHLEAYNSTLV